ncbi:MAG TPA: exodeoxyribonuclease VII small subunit [Candidatus Thermoplasmatota archaeon]|jgi:exodeoxyribonuclease VII small subunit|nr:exodeoxyribonuclease VII small subunit [Candidatus Thermoplasmatota archaeon]
MTEGFEAGLERLEGLVRDLEDGELPLEQALAKYEEGVGLVRGLRTRLDQARLRVQVLQDDGTLRDAPELAPTRAATNGAGDEANLQGSGQALLPR